MRIFTWLPLALLGACAESVPPTPPMTPAVPAGPTWNATVRLDDV